MAELADAQDLGSCEAIRVGSTPTTRTKSAPKTAVFGALLLLYLWLGRKFDSGILWGGSAVISGDLQRTLCAHQQGHHIGGVD